jgi:HD superfamily phosphodiesterase
MAPPFLGSHSHRTYAWARIIATQSGIPEGEVDDELLYVTCLLHDLGLSEAPPWQSQPGCFTLVGAQALRRIGTAAGWDHERIRRGEEAITLHMNPRVSAKRGLEAHLLTRASQLDAMGVGLSRVTRDCRNRVFASYPKNGQQKRGFSALFGMAHHRPKSRARMYRYLGSRWWFYLGP